MSDEEQYNLEPIWKAALAIYREIDRICEKHGLRCFAAYGTALGAIRHRGFIPWDDDFDVCMPRKDYEEFLKVANEELPTKYRLVSSRNRPSYFFFFPKVVLTDRAAVDAIRAQSHLPSPQGIFVDIFPIDGYPASATGRWVRLAATALSRLILKFRKRGWANRIMDLAFALVDYDRAKRVVIGEGWMAEEMKFSRTQGKKWMTAKDFGNGRSVPFADGTIKVPDDYDKYLRFEFGDYMKLPPEEDRHPSHNVEGVAAYDWTYG